MRLLCELGWHKAAPFPRWENGYYFSTCERCGRALARAERGSWAPVAAGAGAPIRRPPYAALLLRAAIVLAAIFALMRSTAPTPEAEPPPPISSRPSPAGRQGAEPATKPPTARPNQRPAPAKRIVAASLLNCRSAPSQLAPVARRLLRGTPVLLLDARGGWSRIAHGRMQCWLRDLYLAPAESDVVEEGERAYLDLRSPFLEQGD